MAGFDGKIKVEISIVLYNQFSFLHLVHKNAAEIYFTFLVAFNWVHSAIEKH